eukprot:TRINITY_DN1618_c3_g1_i1.p1 TRINITY_DN1618_c3_g1~~TRINITY_DN1618_c3_g1_i1.p1  ORF type:complete len:675 (+),score=235.02 TRINITY_DN1618_c3_g1_i1:227-2026(+)
MSDLTESRVHSTSVSIVADHNMQEVLGGEDGQDIELHLSCRNLPNLDRGSLSDPMAVFFVKNRFGKWIEKGRTETVQDSLNPDFATGFRINYRFEMAQEVKFVLVDVDDPKGSIEDQDYIGEAAFKLTEVLKSREGHVTKDLISAKKKTAKKNGLITVTVQEVIDLDKKVKQLISESLSYSRSDLLAAGDFLINFSLSAEGLTRMDRFGRSDPYLVMSKLKENGTEYLPFYRSEIIKNTLDPAWDSFEISVSRICNGDKDKPIRIAVFDWNRDSVDEEIGQVTTTAADLLIAQPGSKIPLQNSKNPEKSSGFLVIDGCNANKADQNAQLQSMTRLRFEYHKESAENNFLDYLAGGTEIDLIVGIDFSSASDNLSSMPADHHLKFKNNKYVTAIESVGRILAEYDDDNRYSVYGFGVASRGEENEDRKSKHLVPLNGNSEDPYVDGVDGVVDLYRRTLQQFDIGEEAMFAPLIRKAADMARQVDNSQDDQTYYILLIISNGRINDYRETVDAIVDASSLPLSIVIVGIGAGDFTVMEQLDADDEALRSSTGLVGERDIVNFVAMEDYIELNDSISPDLAMNVLEEIPGQFLSYVSSSGEG